MNMFKNQLHITITNSNDSSQGNELIYLTLYNLYHERQPYPPFVYGIQELFIFSIMVTSKWPIIHTETLLP